MCHPILLRRLDGFLTSAPPTPKDITTSIYTARSAALMHYANGLVFQLVMTIYPTESSKGQQINEQQYLQGRARQGLRHMQASTCSDMATVSSEIDEAPEPHVAHQPG